MIIARSNTAQAIVQDGVHCNTPEAEWSIFRHWWATFRGVAKRYIHLYLAQYEYRRSRRKWSALERLEEMIGFLFALLQHGLLRLAAVQIPPVRLDLCATLDERS
jgi:hypothetical protein